MDDIGIECRNRESIMFRPSLVLRSHFVFCRWRNLLLRNFAVLYRHRKAHSLTRCNIPTTATIPQIKNYSSHEDEANPSEEGETLEESYENDLDGSDTCAPLKDLMYPNSQDVLIQKLNDCTTPEKLLEVFTENEDICNVKHVTQTVILLWEFYRMQLENIGSLTSRNDFKQLLEKMCNLVDDMNIDELACNFMYLGKLDVDVGHRTMTNILLRCTSEIGSQTDIPLTALSRFSVAVNSTRDLYKFMVCKDILPHLERKLEECSSAEDIRLITICLHNVYQQTTKELILKHKEKINELIDKGELTNKTVKCILKLINFLVIPNWSNQNTALIRKLVLLLENDLENLSLRGIETILKVVQSQLEPSSTIKEISKVTQKMFKENATPEIFACAAQFVTTDKREKMANIAREIIMSKNTDQCAPVNLPALFRALRLLKISDSRTCDAFWDRVLVEISSNANEREPHRLLKHCHRYMHFNNNLGGTYRHCEYEKRIFALVMEELKNGLASLSPSWFSKFAAFVLAYGDKIEKGNIIPEFIVDKMQTMCPQFTIVDCLHISRGIQIALEMRFRKFLPQDIAFQLVKIQNCLNSCTERHIECVNSMSDVNNLIRSYNNRKGSRKTSLYNRILSLYETKREPLNSRSIRDITLNLNTSNYLVPELLDDIFNYVSKNRDYVFGDTVEKVLHCSYCLGFIPSDDEALHWCSEIIKRDFDYMSGLSILQACLALSFYKCFPEDLISRVFSINFIQRIEDEIQSCYSKATYPERVLNQVMQLNRAVCLEFPEARVPWFQQNYFEAQMTKSPIVQSKFHEEVKQYLLDFVTEDNLLRRNHVTPYGYRIDFVLHFDAKKRIIPPPKDQTSIDNITKVGILLLKMDAFCENDFTVLRGSESLKMRHLEMLGYKVIHIHLNDWNSMYMNVPGAKTQYLKSLLEIP